MQSTSRESKGIPRYDRLCFAKWLPNTVYLKAVYASANKVGGKKIWCDLKFQKKEMGGLQIRLTASDLAEDVRRKFQASELELWWSPSRLVKEFAVRDVDLFTNTNPNGYVYLYYENGECVENGNPGRPATVALPDSSKAPVQASIDIVNAVLVPDPVWTHIARWVEGFGLQVAASERPPCFNLILEGVPGTGKTYSLNQLRKRLTRDSGQTGDSQQKDPAADFGQGRFAMTMHPATAYEDFVEGLRPGAPSLPTFPDGEKPQAHGYGDQNTVWFFTNSANDKPKSNPTQTTDFQVHDGFFVRVCREAVHYPDRVFVVLLDEINRCNIPKVLGDLLTTIEASKRARYDKSKRSWDTSKVQVMTLPYSQRRFFVPDNVVVVGTMNTTDRSVAPMDAALRRRFAFARVYPQGFGIGQSPEDAKSQLIEDVSGKVKDELLKSWELWSALNTYLRQFGEDAMLGHSYLYDLRDELSKKPEGATREAEYRKVTVSQWRFNILPQLVDVLVSNDLMDKALKTKSGESLEFKADEKAAGQIKPAARKLNQVLNITARGNGLLRTPTIILDESGFGKIAHGDSTKDSEESAGGVAAASES